MTDENETPEWPRNADFDSITAGTASITNLYADTFEALTATVNGTLTANEVVAQTIKATSIKTRELVILDAGDNPALVLQIVDGKFTIAAAPVAPGDPPIEMDVVIEAAGFSVAAKNATLTAEEALQLTAGDLGIEVKEAVTIEAESVDVVAEEKLYLEGTPLELKSNGDLKLEAQDLVLRGINSVKEDASGVGHSYIASGEVHYWLPPMGGGSSNYPAPPEHPLVGNGDFSEDRP